MKTLYSFENYMISIVVILNCSLFVQLLIFLVYYPTILIAEWNYD